MTALTFVRDNVRFLAVGIVLTLNSSYGQTFFISVFAASIMADFALSDGEWGLVYTAATTASAVVMFFAGALSDRFRVRQLAWLVVPGLAVSCMVMGASGSVTGLLMAIFLLRILGQGMMFQLASVSMARWFVARRGLALSIAGIGFWIGQATLPLVFASLLPSHGWRALWFLAAALVAVTFPLILWLLTLERTPQSLAHSDDAVGMDGRQWTRPEVLRSAFFWMLVPMLLGPPAWGTALFFQQVHIADVKGWGLTDYLALVPLMTVVSVAMTFVAGHLIDLLGSAVLIRVVLVPWLLGFLVLALAPTLSVAALAFVLFGVAHGTQATIMTAFWAEFFGTRHIGSIKAAATSLMVFGSAVGPGLSGVLIDQGLDFPRQMLGIVVYFAASSVLLWIAVDSARRRLPRAGEINVKRA